MKMSPAACSGTRTELIKELRQAQEGWQHYGKPDLASQAEQGIRRLEAGESSVQVGHVMYSVTE